MLSVMYDMGLLPCAAPTYQQCFLVYVRTYGIVKKQVFRSNPVVALYWLLLAAITAAPIYKMQVNFYLLDVLLGAAAPAYMQKAVQT